jgi:allantoinase
MSDRELDLLVRGDLVLTREIARNSAVGVRDGVITGLYGPAENPRAREIVDCRGLLVFPGVVDAHVHSYSVPGTEGFLHSSTAAAAGGVTTFIEMPYDAGGPIVNPQAFRRKMELVGSLAKVDIALLATLKKEGPIDMIPPLVELGACGFKLSLFETDPDRFPRIEDGVLWEVLPMMADHKIPVGFHAENDALILSLIHRSRQEGNIYPRAHCETRPPASETLAVLKLLELAYWTGCRLHLYHISHPRSIRLLQRWREEDRADITTETCPHYLIFHEGDMDRLKALAKINPPLRSREAVEEMWELLKGDRIDMVSSDHAPWPLEKKQAPDIFDNASGAPGVETLLPLMFSEGVVKRGLSPVKLGRILAENPARRFRLFPKKGHIALNADADLAVIDPNARWTLQGKEMHSSARWTPYEGFAVQGRVVRTFLRGKVVYDGKEVTGRAGEGRFLAAQGG